MRKALRDLMFAGAAQTAKAVGPMALVGGQHTAGDDSPTHSFLLRIADLVAS
jgi:hypothetical protein